MRDEPDYLGNRLNTIEMHMEEIMETQSMIWQEIHKLKKESIKNGSPESGEQHE